MDLSKLTYSLALCALATTACGSDDGGGSGGKGDPTVDVSGVVTELASTQPRPPVAGVEVCALDLPSVPCATTDATGAYSLHAVPANYQGALTFSKAGYLTGIAPGMTETEDLVADTSVAPEALAKTFAGLAGFAWPLGERGVLGIDVLDELGNPIEGATVTPLGDGFDGPVYASAAGLPAKELTQTSSIGAAFAVFPAGKATITVTHPSRTCTLGWRGWPSTTGTVDAPVVAGASTVVIAVCK
ncbi:MAG: hypothetical protein U0263_31085 [Polyangiaceae bacterium]